MPAWFFIVAGAASLGLGIVIVWGVMQFSWNDLARRHPAQRIAPDAVRRGFQSFRMDFLNLGFSVHVAVDERFLHLRLIRPLRWLGARPMSIPWDAITLKKRGRLWCTARVGPHVIHGPEWCLGLADPSSSR